MRIGHLESPEQTKIENTGFLEMSSQFDHRSPEPVPVQGSKNCFNHLGPLALAGDGLSLQLEGTPPISDRGIVERMVRESGVQTALTGDTLTTYGRPRTGIIDGALGRRLRVTTCYAAALAANVGWADCPLPGGDAFTHRPIDAHLRVLEAAGAHCLLSRHGRQLSIRFRSAPRAVNVAVTTPFGPSMGASVTGLIVAAQAHGASLLHGLCPEPEVAGVVECLRRLGVRIDELGPDTVRVHGAGGPLSGELRARIRPDRMEAATYLLIGAARRVETTVSGIGVDEFPAGMRETFGRIGLTLSERTGPAGPSVTVATAGEPRGAHVGTGPHPGFPTDVQPQLATFLTQASGPSSVTETVYASRVSHVPELARLGLDISVDGSRQQISGGQRGHGGLAAVRDIRCGAALLIAGAATGQRLVLDDRAGHLARGYSDLGGKLARLGLDLRAVPAA